MKRLILIQNDVAGTGKSTLAACLKRYLASHQALFHSARLVEEIEDLADDVCLQADFLTPENLLEFIDLAPVTILEIETEMAEFFSRFYDAHQLGQQFARHGIALHVVLPVTAEPDTFRAVTAAADIYADSAEYTIAHLVTGSYDEASETWDRSRAARVMDTLDSLEIFLPEIGFQLEMELRAHHTEINDMICEPAAGEIVGPQFDRWMRRTLNQIDGVRSFLFGDAVRVVAPSKTRTKTVQSQRAAAR
jgi:hypothetical protein